MARIQFFLGCFTVINLIFYPNAQYIGRSLTKTNLTAVLHKPIELKCIYNGTDGDGEFLGWFKDGVAVNMKESGGYAIKHNRNESILTINSFSKIDAEVKSWQVKTKKAGYEEPSKCQFGQISLEPSLQGIRTDGPNEQSAKNGSSVSRNKGRSITLKCLLEPETAATNEDEISWDYSEVGDYFTKLPTGTKKQDNQILIDKLEKVHNGYYRCSFDGVSFMVILRVRNRLAALWPFICIVSIVCVLVTIILLFEKRQKMNKKRTDNDANELGQANDPLVRMTTTQVDKNTGKEVVDV